MNIRLALIKDAVQVAEIIKRYREFYGISNQDITEIELFVKERLQNSESKIFIAVEDNTIIGFIQLYPSFSTVSLKCQWILNDFYVYESKRCKGVGSLLMNAVIDYFKEQAKGFTLVTAKSNIIAKQFYIDHGWKTDEYDFFTYFY